VLVNQCHVNIAQSFLAQYPNYLKNTKPTLLKFSATLILLFFAASNYYTVVSKKCLTNVAKKSVLLSTH